MGHKHIIIGVLALAAVTCFSLPAFAASLSVDTANASWETEAVTIPLVFAAESDSVSSMNFTLTFDNTRYDISSITVGAAGSTAGKDVAYNKTSATTAKVIVYGLNATAISDGVVVQATFSVVNGAADGDASFALSDQAAASPAAAAVSMSVVNGTLGLDQTAPVVTITSPAESATLGRGEITVDGTVDDTSIATVLVNGTETAVTDGAFSATVTLDEGENTITVTATDASANEGSASVTVTYTAGDVNEDGIVNVTDITSAKDQLLGTAAYNVTADMNNDGIISIVDLQAIINKTL